MTTMALPSVHPQFVLITVFDEAFLNRLLMGLADRIILLDILWDIEIALPNGWYDTKRREYR